MVTMVVLLVTAALQCSALLGLCPGRAAFDLVAVRTITEYE